MELKRILIFALGPIGSGVLGVVVIPTIAWMFSPADVGRFYLIQTVIAVAITAMYLGLDQSYVREFQEVENRSSLLRATFTPSLAFFALTLCIAIPFQSGISFVLFGRDSAALFWILVGCTLASLVSRQQALVLRMSERALAFSVSQLLPKVVLLAILAGLALVGSEPTFESLALALLAATTSIMVAYLFATRRDWFEAFVRRPPTLPRLRLVKFGVPLMLASLAYIGLTASSAFVLRATSNFDELGVYSVAVSVAGVAAVAQAIFSLVWAPVVYRWVALGADMGRIGGITRQAAAVIVAMFAGCGVFSWVLDFVLPAEYGEVKYLIFCTLLQPLLYTLGEITGIGISISRRTSYSLLSTVIAFVVGIGLNLLLVEPLGAAGAVLANTVAVAVYFVTRTEFSALLWRGFPRLGVYVIVATTIGLAAGTVLLGPALPGLTIAIIWMAYAVVGWVILRDDFTAFARQIRR